MKVRDLKKLLENVPDDLDIVGYESDIWNVMVSWKSPSTVKS